MNLIDCLAWCLFGYKTKNKRKKDKARKENRELARKEFMTMMAKDGLIIKGK